MKLLFVRDMKIPLCITLLALSCTLLIFAVGCNDSAVTEIEVDNQDEQLELIPPSANPEPPELVAEYYALWTEIEREQLDGELDSTKVLKANRLAVELAKYDGTMAQMFETLEIVIDGYSAGKSIEEIKEELGDRREADRIVMARQIISSNPDLEGCLNDCNQDYEDDRRSHEEQFATEAGACVVAGVGRTVSSPNVVGLVVGIGGAFGCVGVLGWRHYRNMIRAKDALDRCSQNCIKEHAPPKPE